MAMSLDNPHFNTVLTMIFTGYTDSQNNFLCDHDKIIYDRLKEDINKFKFKCDLDLKSSGEYIKLLLKSNNNCNCKYSLRCKILELL